VADNSILKEKLMQDLLKLLGHGNQLKRTVRSGWAQRGVPNAESVAAHTFGVVFTTLMLGERIDEELDLGIALAMAALHDLPEGLTTDIPSPAWHYLPAGSKEAAERKAMAQIGAETNTSSQLLSLWELYQAADTIEARLVHDADKLDMFFQALMYEEQTGNRRLQEFWGNPAIFYFPQSQALYDVLRSRREESSSSGDEKVRP
jgi:putative hydrolase of HD superfamily